MTSEYQHEIRMKDMTPFYKKPFPVPEKYRPEVEAKLKKMMEWQIIEELTPRHMSALWSPWQKRTVRFDCVWFS
jgi:hypothetical protein